MKTSVLYSLGLSVNRIRQCKRERQLLSQANIRIVDMPEKRKNNVLMTIFECIIAGALILSCDTMYITLAPYDHLVQNLAMLIVLFGVLCLIIVSKAFLDKKKLMLSIGYTAFFAIYLLAFILITDFQKRPFVKLAVVFLALLFYYFLIEEAGKVPAVLIRYEYIIIVIAAFSVICWLVFSMFRLIPSDGVGMTWWNGTDHYTEVTSYYGVYFEPQTQILFGNEFPKNCGIFVEAPIAALHYSFAILIEVFLQKKMSWVRTIILFIAIGTAFSVTGYMITAAMIIIKVLMFLFSSKKFKSSSPVTKAVIIGAIILVIVLVVLFCLWVLKRRIGGESWRIRLEDFRATFQAWFDKPVFGNGIYNFDAVKAHFEGKRATYAGFSCSNSLGTILADGGIMFGLLYIGSFIMCVIRAVRNREFNVMFFSILVFIIFSVTIVAYDYIIMMMFIFMGAYRCRGARYLKSLHQ